MVGQGRAGPYSNKIAQNRFSAVQPRYIPAQTDEFCHQRPRNWDSRFCSHKNLLFCRARRSSLLPWPCVIDHLVHDLFFLCAKKSWSPVAQGGRLEDRGKWWSDSVLGRRFSEQEDITLSVVSFFDSSTTHGYDIRRGCFNSCVAAALFRSVFHSRTPLVKRKREKHDQFNQSLHPKMSS